MVNKIRLALAIISGRINEDNIQLDEIDLLGYDVYKIAAFGKLRTEQLKEKAEDIIFNAMQTPSN